MKTQTLHPAAVKKTKENKCQGRNHRDQYENTGNANKEKIPDKNGSRFSNSTHTRNKKG